MAALDWQSSNIIREALHVEGKGSWSHLNGDLVVKLKPAPTRTLPLAICPQISPNKQQHERQS